MGEFRIPRESGYAVVAGVRGFTRPAREQAVPKGAALNSARASAKRMLDVAGAIALAIVFLPVILVVYAKLRRESGAVVFAHERIGQYGKPFKVYKFRTMVPDAERVLEDLLTSDPAKRAEWERDHKLKDDPRITKVGRFLRKTSLDELPQLWNVIKGEMSLVGPRPIVFAELSKYGRSAKYYRACKPGVTGLWQVSGRNDIDYSRRVALDRHYATNAGFFMDVVVLLRTVLVVVRPTGAY